MCWQVTWRDSHAPAYVMAETAEPDRCQVLAMIEASHTRLGRRLEALGLEAECQKMLVL